MSLTGEVFVLLGAGEVLKSRDEFSSRGQRRTHNISELNARALAEFGMRPYQLSLLPDDWREWPATPAIVKEMRAWLRAAAEGHDGLQWSGQGSEVLAPLYADALKSEGNSSSAYIIQFHHPARRLAGLVEKGEDTVDPDRSLGLWLKYMLNALRGTKGQQRKVIAFDRCLGYSPKEIWEMADEPYKGEPSEADGLPSLVRRTFEICMAASQDSKALREGKFDDSIDEICALFSIEEKMACAVDLPEDEMIFSWQGANGPTQFKHAYCPTGSWQSFRAAVGAPAGIAVLFDPYRTPCYMWIRKSVWHIRGQQKKVVLQPTPNGSLEEIYDVRRLAIFGPGPATIQTPALDTAEIELEFMIQANDVVQKDLILMLDERLEKRMRSGAQRR